MNPDYKKTYVVFNHYFDPDISYFEDFGKAYTEYLKRLEEKNVPVALSTLIEYGNFDEGSEPEDMLE